MNSEQDDIEEQTPTSQTPVDMKQVERLKAHVLQTLYLPLFISRLLISVALLDTLTK